MTQEQKRRPRNTETWNKAEGKKALDTHTPTGCVPMAHGLKKNKKKKKKNTKNKKNVKNKNKKNTKGTKY